MTTMTAMELTDHISEALQRVREGEEIVAQQEQENVAVLIPFARYQRQSPRKFGLLAGKASFEERDDFKMKEEDLISGWAPADSH